MKTYGDRFILKIKHYKVFEQYTYYPLAIKGQKKKSSNTDEIKRCSSSRTISLIKDYVLSNDFDYFFTLTIKDDRRYDVITAINLINNSISCYKKRAKNRGIDFKYVYVFEKTKNDGIHLHGFFSGFYDLYTNQYGHLSSCFFDDIGFQNFIDGNKVNEFYLIKYISKEPIEELKHRFYHSRNLNKPSIDIIHDNFKEFCNLPFTFVNEYCKMMSVSN